MRTARKARVSFRPVSAFLLRGGVLGRTRRCFSQLLEHLSWTECLAEVLVPIKGPTAKPGFKGPDLFRRGVVFTDKTNAQEGSVKALAMRPDLVPSTGGIHGAVPLNDEVVAAGVPSPGAMPLVALVEGHGVAVGMVDDHGVKVGDLRGHNFFARPRRLCCRAKRARV